MSCGCEKKLEQVGKVTPEERDEIQSLYKRLETLKELFMVLNEKTGESGKVDDVLYQKLIKDISDTKQNFQLWWDKMNEKYKWKSEVGAQWKIDFGTCDIILMHVDNCK